MLPDLDVLKMALFRDYSVIIVKISHSQGICANQNFGMWPNWLLFGHNILV